MIQRALRGLVLIGFGALATSAIHAQDAAAPAPEAPKPAASATGGNIFADFNMGMPDEAFDLVAKQAGVELVVNNDSMWATAEPITLKVEGGYFWPVFLDMCKQANIRFQSDNYGGPSQGRRLRLWDARQLQDGMDRLPKSVYQGFVIMPQSANRMYNINYSQPTVASTNPFSIQMQVYVDPATPVSGWGIPTITEAVDENGTSLLPRDDRSNTSYGNNSSLVQTVAIPLANPVNIGKKIVSLKGTLRASAVTKMEKVDLDLPLPPEGKTIKTSDGDIVIGPLTQRGGQAKSYDLKVRFSTASEDGKPRGGLRRQNQDRWNLVSQIGIKDAQGKPLNYSGGGGGGDDGQGNVTYNVLLSAGQDVGEPAKLSWRLPVTTKQIPIPFEFKDLPIP